MKLLILLIITGFLVGGCASYTTVTKIGKDRVALSKNDAFLGGIWPGPKVYVCKVTTKGLSECSTKDNP